MENTSGLSKEEENIELPPGFRFHPTDEELISHYLSPKVLNHRFCARAIGEVDLNKCEPWELPRRAKMGEKEWYFFCMRDRKYPTGLRTNRATEAGYWKATGKDKEIYKAKTLVGMKKTLVFYEGRAPKGEKTNWVMHEYRLEGKYSVYNLPKTAKNEWVICRVFQKSSGGKKPQSSGLMRLSSHGNEYRPSLLPPLMDSPPYNNDITGTSTVGKTSHVTCFSDPMEDQKTHQKDIINRFNTINNNINNNNNNNPLLASSSSSSNPSDIISPASFQFLSKNSVPIPNPLPYANQIATSFGNLQYPESFLMQDHSILKMLLENHAPNTKRNSRTEFSQDTGGLSPTDLSSAMSNHHDMVQRSFEDQDDPSSSVCPVDLDCLWNY